MEPNTHPTLAEAIAAGNRLLARMPRSRPAPDEGEPPALTGPRSSAVEAPVDVPAPTDDDWRTAAEIALLVRCSPWTVAEHLRNGSLHGHREAADWSVRGAVADAFHRGATPAVQRRLCGCRALRLVEPGDVAAAAARPVLV